MYCVVCVDYCVVGWCGFCGWVVVCEFEYFVCMVDEIVDCCVGCCIVYVVEVVMVD